MSHVSKPTENIKPDIELAVVYRLGLCAGVKWGEELLLQVEGARTPVGYPLADDVNGISKVISLAFEVFIVVLPPVFTARLHDCNATHGIALAILSVCPSIRQMRVLWQN